MGKASRDKGKRGELEARDQVRRIWKCPGCIRSAQVSGQFASDLMGGPDGLHLEVKRYRRVVAADFMQQAKEDAKASEIPTVLLRENEGEWLVMVRMEDTVEWARRIIEAVERGEDSLRGLRGV